MLREFLWEKWRERGRFAASSVQAGHYNPKWRNLKSRKPPLLVATKDPIDKQLAHLAKERGDASFTNNLADAVPELRSILIKEWNRFLESLSGTEWDKAFAEQNEARRKDLGLS